MLVKKHDGTFEEFDLSKAKKGIQESYAITGEKRNNPEINEILDILSSKVYDGMESQEIRRIIEEELVKRNFNAGKQYILHWAKKESTNQFILDKENFIAKYKKSFNNADSTIDDNSNVNTKNISMLNTEIHKSDNILVSRGMITRKLKELYPKFNSNNYVQDLENHIIYKNDESSFTGAISPYCYSISMYPFLLNGIEKLGGLSAAPKNIDSFCGMYCNLIFFVASQAAGAVATPEVLTYFSWFAQKEWGKDFYLHTEDVITSQNVKRTRTIKQQIHQYYQQIIYTINQPAGGGRGSQSAFTNWAYFDEPFFRSMFGNFYFPDGTQPEWEAVKWIQKDFMMWFNEERTKCLLTFPVESFALIYKDGKFVDEESARFVSEELERGHSFFIYISDTADSLSSCCFGEDEMVLYRTRDGIEKTTTFKEMYDSTGNSDIIYVPYDGKWSEAKAVRLEKRDMFKVSCDNGVVFVATDNHIHPTNNGEKITSELTIDDFLLFGNTEDFSGNVENPLLYSRVTDVEPIHYAGYVYCVEIIDKNIPYFILPNGLITHNCRLKNKIQTKEFSFTNGNMGVETGSKSVITLNLSRITQDFCRKEFGGRANFVDFTDENKENYRKHIVKILERVYKYHNAYNELLWDMYDANLLPVYKAGFIDLNKQYLTIGLNGLNQAAEFLGLECHKNDDYSSFCRFIFGTIKSENEKHKTKKTNFNTEQIPAESLAVKNYNWDKADGYWVPEDTNLYASYIFKPNEQDSVLDKLYMMGKNFAADSLDGGAACHINLEESLTKEQYYRLLKYAGDVGCSYLGTNIPNSRCPKCGYITKHPIKKCPKCGNEDIELYDRIIGYLTKIKNWSEGRRIEQKTRVYTKKEDIRI